MRNYHVQKLTRQGISYITNTIQGSAKANRMQAMNTLMTILSFCLFSISLSFMDGIPSKMR